MKTEPMIEKAKRRLGRGLSSLIGEPVPVIAPPAEVGERPGAAGAMRSNGDGMAAGSRDRSEPNGGTIGMVAESARSQRAAPDNGIVHVEVGAIVPSRFQPRREMDGAGLESLAGSIRRSGLLQPVIVRPRGSAGYELVAGERRWRAAQIAGLAQVPAVVRNLSDEEAAEWGLVENLQREDLNPMDRAASLRLLCERFGLRQEDVAARVGLDRSSVANLIRLTELEEPLARLVASGVLGAGHGRALLSLPAGEARIDLGVRAGKERWSVRRLESEVAARTGARPKRPARDPFDAREAARQRVEKRLSDHLKTKVRVGTDRSGANGRITIEFWGLDQFEGLLERLGLDRHAAE